MRNKRGNCLTRLQMQELFTFAYNVETSVCEDGHGFFGEVCPNCGKNKSDVYSRVVGFLTPRSSYSKERKLEFDNRKWFGISNDN